jgi:hypothetical protein
MFTGVHKTQRMASASAFLERYHKDGNEFVNLIIGGTDDETWFSFMNVETKSSQSSGCALIHQTSQKSLNNCCLPRKLMAAVFWERKEVLMVESFQHGTTVTSEVYC